MLKKITIALLMITIALASFTKVAPWAANPETHQHEIEQIDDKIDTALVLVAVSTAASATLSCFKDDSFTPIAEEMSDIAKWFGIVLAALYLEKYLLTLTGYISFSLLIPLAAVALGIGWIFKKERVRGIAYKLIIIATACYLLVPASVKVSDIIYSTYETSIEATINDATNLDLTGIDETESNSLVDKIKDVAASLFEKAKAITTNFIEAIAVMMVTTCLIPVIVLALFIWVTKILIGYQISDSRVIQIVQESTKRIEEKTNE